MATSELYILHVAEVNSQSPLKHREVLLSNNLMPKVSSKFNNPSGSSKFDNHPSKSPSSEYVTHCIDGWIERKLDPQKENKLLLSVHPKTFTFNNILLI